MNRRLREFGDMLVAGLLRVVLSPIALADKLWPGNSGDWKSWSLPEDTASPVTPLQQARFRMENARKYGSLAEFTECEAEAVRLAKIEIEEREQCEK